MMHVKCSMPSKIYRSKPHQKLCLSENGLTSNQKQQVKIITTHFQNQFHKDADKLQEISPTEMKNNSQQKR